MRVVVYSTSRCPFCKMAKDFLNDHNIRYEVVDVGEDKEAAREMIEKSGQMGVPVIEIIGNKGKNEIIIGFDVNRLKKTLKIKD